MRIVALVLILAVLAPARDAPQAVSSAERARAEAIRGGLRFLAETQQRDGSWGIKARVGITSIALLAFLAQGEQIGRGPYGRVIEKGVRYLLSCSLPPAKSNPLRSTVPGKPSGYFWGGHSDTDSKMHGHGYATQVLGLVWGTGIRSAKLRVEMRRKIRMAIRVIEDAQTFTGGWGYEPSFSTNHEGSITVTVAQALRVVRDAGFIVDREVHERGLKYLKESQKADGSFRYSHARADSTPALTSAALCAMHGFSEYESKTTRAAMDYLREHHRRAMLMRWPFYGPYYAAQVFYRRGGRDWTHWNREWVPFIIARADRTKDGLVFWDDAHRGRDRAQGRPYATAFSCLTLSVPDGLLPLFQK